MYFSTHDIFFKNVFAFIKFLTLSLYLWYWRDLEIDSERQKKENAWKEKKKRQKKSKNILDKKHNKKYRVKML